MTSFIATQAKNLLNLTKKEFNSKTKAIAITSGKGGVGKSTVCANLAYLLSLRDKKVAIIDADLGLANQQILFDLKPKYSFYDYIEKKIDFKDILIPTHFNNITLLAGKSGHQFVPSNSSYSYANIINDVKEKEIFDYILIDTGAGINDFIKEFLTLSDEVIAVTTTDPSALTDVYAMIKMVSEFKNKINLIFNQTKNFSIGQTITNSIIKLAQKNNINKKFIINYFGNISQNMQVATTGRLRKIYTKEFPNDLVTYEFEKVLQELLRKW